MKQEKRLDFLRQEMRRMQVDAVIIPTADPHLSEYTADHWRFREWCTGFTGSAGTLVLTLEAAGLWTDSRYFIQAAQQLPQEITLYKEDTPGTPSLKEWIASQLTAGATLGIDDELFSVESVREMRQFFSSHGIILKCDTRLSEKVEMPPLPHSPLFVYPIEYAGKTVQEKISDVFGRCQTDWLLLSALDEIAWLFNLRGGDVSHTPVFNAYAIAGETRSALFTDTTRVDEKVSDYLKENDILLCDYTEIIPFLEGMPASQSISIDPQSLNHKLFSAMEGKEVKETTSPVKKLKAIRNEVELTGLRNAMRKDGVALTRAFMQIERTIESGEKVTEMDVAVQLLEERRKETDFFCESFGTIAGFKEHGAIVHYSATEESNATITSDGSLLLVDSGANYLDGTTDITRTLCFGTPSDEAKRDYTLVLKGHIALARCKFPQGTEGAKLHSIAQQFLWSEGLTYGHGTGHGIGHFLCVHEGPQNIRAKGNGVALEQNMILSDEPGVYKEGKYGIRIENMLRVTSVPTNETPNFLQFETLTLFPYERKLIKTELLTDDEIGWINEYHQRVYTTLSPLISEEEKHWLQGKTEKIRP